MKATDFLKEFDACVGHATTIDRRLKSSVAERRKANDEANKRNLSVPVYGDFKVVYQYGKETIEILVSAGSRMQAIDAAESELRKSYGVDALYGPNKAVWKSTTDLA